MDITRLIRRVRQNHALEHATIEVLLERGARPPIGGNAALGGFFIYGRLPTEEVASAASEALQRLHGGERDLAVSPYCGTNLVVGAVLAGLLSGIIIRRKGILLQRLPIAAVAIMGASLMARPLGNEVQRRYTTLADLRGIHISSVRCIRAGDYAVHRVNTQSLGRG